MASKKVRYCDHDPKTKIFNRSKSSKLVCCDTCYLMEIRKLIVESFGEEFAQKLDHIKNMDFSKAFPQYEYKVI